MSVQTYFIRHGYALHNDLFWSIGKEAYTKYRDTPLLYKGFLQAEDCRENYVKNGSLKNTELVLVSPLSRTINTALSIFGSNTFFSTKIIALDCLMEYPLGGDEMCNKRKNIKILEHNYPTIDYSFIKNKEVEWPFKKESIAGLEKRIEKMVKFIKNRYEKKIAVVSHSSYISQYLRKDIGDEHNDLIHCFPYGPYTVQKYKL